MLLYTVHSVTALHQWILFLYITAYNYAYLGFSGRSRKIHKGGANVEIFSFSPFVSKLQHILETKYQLCFTTFFVLIAYLSYSLAAIEGFW